VRRFQEARGLHEVGVCDDDTWSALVEASWELGDRLLFLTAPNQRGDDVAALQTALAHLGFDAGKIDGIFGPRTDAALRELQSNLGVTVDGLCGPDTVRLIALVSSQSGSGPGMATLRERERLAAPPGSLADCRIVVGHFGGLSSLTRGLARDLRRHAATVMTLDEPEVSAQAQATNQFAADAYVGFESHPDEVALIHFYQVTAFESLAGRALAEHVARLLRDVPGLPAPAVAGKRLPILRETRMPAVLCRLGPARVVTDAANTIAGAVLDALEVWASRAG
jgi:N-acetylmuramoyl-L-alanine amidase